MSHYSEFRDLPPTDTKPVKSNGIDLPICTMCQDDEKPSLTNTNVYGWMCDECIAEMEHYDNHCEEYEARKRERIAEQNEY